MSTSKGKDNRNNILNILSNVESVDFNGLYFNYHDNPESKVEESIKEKAKLRRHRFYEIKKIEENIKNCLKHTLRIIKVQVICTKN